MAFGDLIQEKANDGSGATLAVTLDSTPTEGNLLVCCHYSSKQTASGPSGWTTSVFIANDANSDDLNMTHKIAGASESTTVTVDNGSSGQAWMYVVEFEGPWDATPLDKTATDGPQTSDSTPTVGPTATTAQDDELLVAFVGGEDISPAGSWTDSFTEIHDTGNLGGAKKEGAVASRLVTSTGAYQTTVTVDGGFYDTCFALATYKQGSGGGGGRTTYNTDSHPLGIHTGMAWRINQP